MAVDRTKILEAAQKHLSKGAHDKAILELRKLVAADPSDVRTWLKIGDLHVKLNQRPQAIDTYSRVADQYAEQGFFHKAVAVYRQILNLDPSRLDIELKLAEMHEAMQLTTDAMNAYEHIASEYGRQGDVEHALDTFARMVRLDPTSIPTTIKYAEALSRAGRADQAADAFAQGAELLKAQGRIDDYLKVVERLLFHREDLERSRELATLYLQRGDGKRALAKLQIVFKADPKHIPTLELLAHAFELIQQLPKTISVLREIAHLHGEQGHVEERARALQRILALDPGDLESRRALAQMAGPARAPAPAPKHLGPPPGAVIEPSRAARMLSEPPEEIDPDLELVEEGVAVLDDGDHGGDDDSESVTFIEEDDDAPSPSGGGEPTASPDLEVAAGDGGDDDDEVLIIEDDFPDGPVDEDPALHDDEYAAVQGAELAEEPAPRASLPPDVAHEANLAKLMTEVEVFLRYGLKDKVVEQLRRVIALDPQHVEAREKLRDVFIEQGHVAAALDESVALADLFAADKPAVAALYLRQAQDLAPDDASIAERLRALEGGAASQRPAAPRPLSSPPSAIRPESVVESASSTAASFRPPPAERVAGGPKIPLVAPPRRPIVPKPATAPRQALVPAPVPLVPSPPAAADPRFEDVSEQFVEEAPIEPAIPARRDPLAPISLEEFESAPLRPSAPDVAAEARLSMPPGEVEEILDEAEFFVAQGLFHEGLQVIRDALAVHPRNRLLADRAAEISEQAARSAEKLVSEAPPASDNSFLLAEKLADELDEETNDGSDVLDVEEVFAQFKRGVAQQVAADDSDTHFDLGIAYKEMGLHADAIHEFELCLSNPARECMAHTMIGLCHVERGDLVAAVSAFKKGLYIEHKTDREELGLYFELGRAYEGMSDPQEALYYYEKVRKRDPGFLNVQDRIDALQRGQSGAAPKPEPTTELDAAFDELMSKD